MSNSMLIHLGYRMNDILAHGRDDDAVMNCQLFIDFEGREERAIWLWIPMCTGRGILNRSKVGNLSTVNGDAQYRFPRA